MRTLRAFTLLELLVVIAIMGIMGAASVGGYRAMQRGMEERGVMQNVNQFIRSAYQRAQIDRQPVAVYFWNETIRDESDEDETMIVVGRAVAVRSMGRLSIHTGEYLGDEFGDLYYQREVDDGDDENEAADTSRTQGNGVYLYNMRPGIGNSVKGTRTLVYEATVSMPLNEWVLGDNMQRQIDCWAYQQHKDNDGLSASSWKVGDPYGMEFASIELPHNFIFGSTISRNLTNPVAGESMMRFKVGRNEGDGAASGTDGTSTILVSSLRPDSSGNLSPQKVDMSDRPDAELN